jgi:hypothetical protein
VVVEQALGSTAEKVGAMTSDQTFPIKHSKVRAFVGHAASTCGGALNELMVVVGAKLGLYKSGQYSLEREEPLAPRRGTTLPPATSH